LVLEIGLLKDRIAGRERERDHANLVSDSALRENKSLVERVKRLEAAGDLLAEWHLAVVTTREKAWRDVARWNEAKGEKP
jgi:predicted amidohydrolase YtcJ